VVYFDNELSGNAALSDHYNYFAEVNMHIWFLLITRKNNMTISVMEDKFVALVGLDWADKKHDVCLLD